LRAELRPPPPLRFASAFELALGVLVELLCALAGLFESRIGVRLRRTVAENGLFPFTIPPSPAALPVFAFLLFLPLLMLSLLMEEEEAGAEEARLPVRVERLW